MKFSTIIGISGAGLIVAGAVFLAPDSVSAFFNLPGLIVVIGGTLIATFVSRPVKDVRAVLRDVPGLFRRSDNHTERDILQLLRFARRLRYGNLRTAEQELGGIQNSFLRSSLRRVVDSDSLENVHKAMQWRINGIHSTEQNKIQIMQTMSVFAPAFGMLGTLFGLVHMLSGLGNSGLNEIGGSMAFAMMTTVYGIVIANLIFKPLAMKMERRLAQLILHHNVLKEGVLQICRREHPTMIKDSLEAYYSQSDLAPANLPRLSLVQEA